MTTMPRRADSTHQLTLRPVLSLRIGCENTLSKKHRLVKHGDSAAHYVVRWCGFCKQVQVLNTMHSIRKIEALSEKKP